MAHPSYASTLKLHLAHSPVRPSKEEEQSIAEKLRRHERMEPELVVTATHFGKHALLHSTKTTPGEQSLDDLFHCSFGFLINKKAWVVTLNEEKD
jgi:hypothetical protein